MVNTWKVVLAFVTVFVAGAVFGGVFTLSTANKRFLRMNDRPQPQAQLPGPGAPGGPGGQGGKQNGGGGIGPAMMRQLTQQLKLTDEQKEKIRPLVARAGEDLQRLRRENLQTTTRVMERMHSDISAWLTEEQRTELENLKHKLQERVRTEQKRRGDTPRPNAQTSLPGAHAEPTAAAAEPVLPKGK